MNSKPKVYFRADGNAQMGLGHVIRSLALAEMINDAYDCIFIIRNPLPVLQEQINSTCKFIVELPLTIDDEKEADNLLKILGENQIVVLDGYHFSTTYQQKLRKGGHKVLYIDDIQPFHFVADVVINHSGGLNDSNFSKEKYTTVYHGLKYALLRKPFRIAAQNRTYLNNENSNVIICFGGADPLNDTLSAIQQCENKYFVSKLYVVLGGAYQHHSTLESYIEDSSLNIEVLTNLNAQEMVDYMQKCSYAIMPPSSVSYEYLSIGGILFLKTIADNQAKMYDFFIKENIAFSLDNFREIKEKKRILDKQSRYFDGRQKERFLKIFNDFQ